MVTSDFGELQWSVAGRSIPGEALSWDNYLVLATDGIDSDFVQMIAGRDPERLSASILNNYAKPTDDALVLVACWHSQAGRQEDNLK